MNESLEIPRPDPEPGDWTTGNRPHLEIESSHAVSVTHAEPAVRKILRGEASSLTDAERATLGYLNYFCFLKGYEPLVVLMPDREP
ncbi:MAG: hypothetical protein Q4G43_01275 [Mobilicoccus sp.]|nr:hypothetical protein [Mobilicoccus sp.]